jgi:hypothetical protein
VEVWRELRTALIATEHRLPAEPECHAAGVLGLSNGRIEIVNCYRFAYLIKSYPRGVLNSIQGSLKAEYCDSRGYVERLSLPFTPGTVPAIPNRRFQLLQRNLAIRSSWPATISRFSTPASSKTVRLLPVTSGLAGHGSPTC